MKGLAAIDANGRPLHDFSLGMDVAAGQGTLRVGDHETRIFEQGGQSTRFALSRRPAAPVSLDAVDMRDLSIDHRIEGGDEPIDPWRFRFEDLQRFDSGFDRGDVVGLWFASDPVTARRTRRQADVAELLQPRVHAVEALGMRPRAVDHEQRAGAFRCR